MTETRNDCGDRPVVAIIANSQTPYRLALHRRIVAEIPTICLFSLYTHQVSNSDWAFEAPAEIRPVLFGEGESSADQDKIGSVAREWRRGGRVIEWLQQHDAKFVVMMGYNDAGRIRTIRWCKRAGVPCFLFGDSNIHGDATGLKAAVKKLVVGSIVKSCAGVLPCGTLGEQYFLKYGAEPGRIFYFPYEPDYGLIERTPPADLPPGRRRIVYSGRLTAHKRVDLLIDAFKAIAPTRPDWDLVVIGDGPDRAALQARAGQGRVQWLGFLDDQAGISAIYKACDVLVLPSDYEPWALVVNEAAAAGLAIVCSSVVGAAAELVRDGVNGRAFAPGDLDGLIAALTDVTGDKIDGYKAASAGVLADWRRRGDPVDGLRKAMASAHVRF